MLSRFVINICIQLFNVFNFSYWLIRQIVLVFMRFITSCYYNTILCNKSYIINK